MGNEPEIEQDPNTVAPKEVAQMGLEPFSLYEGYVALRFISHEPWNSKATKHSGYRVKLEDGCPIYITHPHVLLMLRDQLEVRYKVLPWSTGYCLEYPEEVLDFTVKSQTPVIINRVLRMIDDGRSGWHHQIVRAKAKS